MKLSQDDVLHVARLARLRVNKDEVARFCRDLSSVLAYMDMLKEVDTGDWRQPYTCRHWLTCTGKTPRARPWMSGKPSVTHPVSTAMPSRYPW